jgi:hypothetical protein
MMSELTEQEKQLLAMMEAAEEEQLKNPPSEPVRPMASWKMEDPIGLIEVDGKETINISTELAKENQEETEQNPPELTNESHE